MRRRVRTGIVVTAALVAAVTLYVASTLPPASLRFAHTQPPTHVTGAYHIHTNRSDGSGSLDDVAAAAGRAGLQFLVVTDHGDATRQPEPAAYRHGVLTIDAVELNTQEGHIVALGLDDAAPYPLAGPARDVIEDVRRLGGTVVLAHPDSPRRELAWQGNAAADGIEWLNVDSEWRDEPATRLARLAVRSLFRGPESVASVFSRPAGTLARWDTAARTRPLFGVAALDAHANIDWREQPEPRERTRLAWPSYETMFRTLTQTVILSEGLSGEARVDAPRVLAALTMGQSYSTVRAHGWPATLLFTAQAHDRTYEMGSRVDNIAAPVRFTASTPDAPQAHIVILRDGRPAAAGQGSVTLESVTDPGVYRVEATLPDRDMPWLVSNPITLVDGADGPRTASDLSPDIVLVGKNAVRIAEDSPDWTIEREPSSDASTRADSGRRRVDYQLGSGESRGQYVALVHDEPSGQGIDRIQFVGHSSVPMRVSVQVRLPDGHGRAGQRWRRSVYLDTDPRTITLRLQDFDPADRPTTRRPIVTPIGSLLFVVDTINALPGSSGTIWLSEIALGVSSLE